jgi:hypothetical protein
MIISPSAISPYKIPTFQSGGGSGFDPDAQAYINALGADALQLQNTLTQCFLE